MKSSKTGRGSDQFPLRLPDGLRGRIKDAADKNNRSMNAEIVSTLEEKFPPPTTLDFERTIKRIIGTKNPEVRKTLFEAFGVAVMKQDDGIDDVRDELYRLLDLLFFMDTEEEKKSIADDLDILLQQLRSKTDG